MIQYICAYCDSLSEADVEVLVGGAKLTCNECGKTTDVYLCTRYVFYGEMRKETGDE
jgi:hypothetical protein